jgi:hypothetical protein
MKRNIALEWSAGKSFAAPLRLKRGFIKYTPIVISFLLAALFLYAAYNKLIIYQRFVQQLKQSPILGGYEGIFSWLVPGTEIVVAGLLILKRTRLAGLWAGFFLMLAFTAYVYVLPHFFKAPGCSCGGIISHFTWQQHFYFNLGFTLLAGLGLSLFPQTKTT